MAKNIIKIGNMAESRQKRKTVVISCLTELAEVVEKTMALTVPLLSKKGVDAEK